MKVVKKEAKTNTDALNKALEELNAREEEVFYYFKELEGGLFKGKKVEAYAVTKYEVKEFIKNYLNELAHLMNTKFNIEVKESEVGFNVLIITDDNAILIGKDGKNLNNIQLLLRQSINKYGNFDIKVNLDISNYKAKKENRLAFEVKKIAKEVLKTKIDAKLDPMNSYERRIVHNVVSNFKNLVTESEGETPNRYVVIKYKKD